MKPCDFDLVLASGQRVGIEIDGVVRTGTIAPIDTPIENGDEVTQSWTFTPDTPDGFVRPAPTQGHDQRRIDQIIADHIKEQQT